MSNKNIDLETIKQINYWQEGLLSEIEEIVLFSELVANKKIHTLESDYIKRAIDLINLQVLDRQGSILVDLGEYYE